MDKQVAIDLIKDAGFGFLATTDGNQPRVRAVAPYLAENNTFLLALFAGRRTIPQIQKNPQIELCFVDRKMAYCRLSGKAKVTTEKAKRQLAWDNLPMMKQYFSGPEDQKMVLLEISIVEAEAMTQNDRVPQKVVF
jgi:uncharacterized pyridoxamine 5'-phosphate oxidase family protein